MAMLGPVRLAQQVGDIEHLAVHGQDNRHHHHADQALHMDDVNNVAAQHFHADSGTNTAGLLTSLLPVVSPIRSMSPLETSHVIWLSPTLEGPLRPPMRNVA